MPVDAAQALVGKKGSRTASKRVMAERDFKQGHDPRRLCADQFSKRGLLLQGVERACHVFGIADVAAEVVHTVVIPGDQARILLRDQRGDQEEIMDLFPRKAILFEEAGQVAVWIQNVAVLISTV